MAGMHRAVVNTVAWEPSTPAAVVAGPAVVTGAWLVRGVAVVAGRAVVTGAWLVTSVAVVAAPTSSVKVMAGQPVAGSSRMAC